MSQRTFCDVCDQELVIPDEKVDFISGQPNNGKGDICWRCRLSEIVDLYNEKTKDWERSPRVGMTFTTELLGSGNGNTFTWNYSREMKGPPNAQP